MTDKPVFDSSPIGETVTAERGDAPGSENFALRDGSGDDSGFSIKRKAAGDMRVQLARGRVSGDWSWQPARNLQFAQFAMPAYIPAKHPLAGIRF